MKLSNGIALNGFSTHQSFMYPDAAERKKNVELVCRQIEQAYAMGIPTVRVNTGTWKTSKDFDELMKKVQTYISEYQGQLPESLNRIKKICNQSLCPR